MFVIPPSTQHEEYFRDLAETTWDLSERKHKNMCNELKTEHKTLVVTCKVELEDTPDSYVHLHYRYFKDKLYCFIEESEQSETN